MKKNNGNRASSVNGRQESRLSAVNGKKSALGRLVLLVYVQSALGCLVLLVYV